MSETPATVIIKALEPDDPDLDTSRLFDAFYKTAAYAKKHKGIKLTHEGYLSRNFITWASQNFNWPEYSEDALTRQRDIIRQQNMPPADSLHNFMLVMGYGRHLKGALKIPAQISKRLGQKNTFFAEFATNYFIRYDHKKRMEMQPNSLEHWQIYLNAINQDCDMPSTSKDILTTLYGYSSKHRYLNSYQVQNGYLIRQFLQPLSWLGFLEETHFETGNEVNHVHYRKTALWHKALDFSQIYRPRVRVTAHSGTKKYKQPKELKCL